MLAAVEKELWSIEERLSTQHFNFQNSKLEMKERKTAISQGSLKELISHFEKGTICPGATCRFQFDLQHTLVADTLAKLYETTNVEGQSKPIHTPTQAEETESEATSSVCHEVVSMKDSVTRSTKEKPKRKGIFVASSPEMKKFSSCEKFTTNAKASQSSDKAAYRNIKAHSMSLSRVEGGRGF